MSRFEFLQVVNSELYSLCQSAEENILYDLDVAMFKARQSLEAMLRYIDEQMLASHRNLNAEINYLYSTGILPHQVKSYAHDVRKYANDCVHHRKVRSDDSSGSILDKLMYIIIWYVVIYKKEECSLEDFSSSVDRRFFCDLTGQVYIDEDDCDISEASEDIATYEPVEKTDYQLNDEVIADIPDYNEEVCNEEEILEEKEQFEEYSKDIFETDEEYRERIRAIQPVYIGSGVLSRKNIDKYTDVALVDNINLINHSQIAVIENIRFFCSGSMIYDNVVEGKIAASLDVYDEHVCYDYSKVFFYDYMGNAIPLQVVSWERFPNESQDDYVNRLNKLPILPMGFCKPDKMTYSMLDGTINFYISPHDYVRDIFTLDELTLQINRDMAKEFCHKGEEYNLYSVPKYAKKENKFYLDSIRIQSDDESLAYSCNFDPIQIKAIFGCETEDFYTYGDKREAESQYKNWEKILKSKVGDFVELGKYPLCKGKSEAIQWEILLIEERKILLVSRFAIDASPFHNKEGAVTWHSSNIREYLNGKFYNTAFNDREKKIIKESIILPEGNISYDVDAGDVTCDRIFLFCASEVKRFMPLQDNRKKIVTSYALEKGAYTNGNDTCRWWLRNPGHSNDTIAEVDYNGQVHYYGMSSEYGRCGVCPAMWISVPMMKEFRQ